MNSFLGEYEVTIDAKGRFSLPAGFKKQLGEEDLSFVINRGFEKCLSMYPKSSWDILFDKISGLNDFDPKVRMFRRQFLGGATQIELDSAGRVLLPSVLREYAGLKKTIVLTSGVNKIEIWDAEEYRKTLENFSAEDFSNIANQVMGNSGSIDLSGL